MPLLSNKKKSHFTLKPQKCAPGFVGGSLFWKFHGQKQAVWLGMPRIKCPVFQVSQPPFKARGLPGDLLWVFTLNGALECSLYLHCTDVSIPKPSWWSTSQEREGANVKDSEATFPRMLKI